MRPPEAPIYVGDRQEKRWRRRGHRGSGITVAELLIALAVCGVLLAIALPAYQDYRIGRHLHESNLALDDFFRRDIGKSTVAGTLPAGITSQAHFQRANLVDKLYASLPSAFTYIGAPTSMGLDETRLVHLALSVPEIVDVSTLFFDENVIDSRQIKISDRMQVLLESQDFEIKEHTPATQAVRRQGVTQWSWGINPKRAGKHKLSLAVFAIVKVADVDTPLVLTTYTRTIEVQVPPSAVVWTFLKENLGWLWAPLAALGGGFLFLYKKARKRKARR